MNERSLWLELREEKRGWTSTGEHMCLTFCVKSSEKLSLLSRVERG